MDIPTDRLLIMLVVATGFAVLLGGWAGALVHAEATGLEELLLRVVIGALFFGALVVTWSRFRDTDEGSA